MNNLTKEECHNAYVRLHNGGADLTYLSIFAQLIKEHFEMVALDDFRQEVEKFNCNETYFKTLIKVIAECKDEELKESAVHCLCYLKNQIEKDERTNTAEFKHFKLHSDSTLKSFKKDELIDYIHMLYHNWGTCDESYYNAMNYAKKLQEENSSDRREVPDEKV